MGSIFEDGDPDFNFPALCFDKLPRWKDDDHLAAFRAFLRSCRSDTMKETKTVFGPFPYQEALALGPDISSDGARKFFETHFVPRCRVDSRDDGFVTGYYEPVVRGSRTRGATFNVPVYGLPDDIVPLHDDVDTYRALYNNRVSAKRRCGYELDDYFTRAQIEAGALQGRGLELFYLDDWVEAFFMQVQGSGLVQLDDGTAVRLSYAGKNGHPYTSIARVLVDRREIDPREVDTIRIKQWLRADTERGRALLHENESYVFFRELSAEEECDGPLGAENVTLTPGRSLAIDPTMTPLGCPIYLIADDLFTERGLDFARLMIGQDVGSAIRGPKRGDIFWGTGDAAGQFAGTTRHRATFFFLLPKR